MTGFGQGQHEGGSPACPRRVQGRRALLAFWGAVALVGCSGGGGNAPPPPADGGLDAAVVDGGLVRDSAVDGAPADAGAADTSPGDTGPAALCTGACDPLAAGDCPDAGACVLGGGEAQCTTPGELEEGAACLDTDACAPGLACFLTRTGGACGRVCCPSDEGGCAEGERCGGPGMLYDGTTTAYRTCVPPRPCDVLDAEACEPAEACYIVAPDGGTDCRAAGTAAVGDPCVNQNDCQAGLACVGLVEPTCVRICAIDATLRPQCPTAEGECVVYSQSPEGTGLCTLAAAARSR